MTALWAGVVAHLWHTTLVLALIACLALLLRRAPARYQEALWSAGLLKLLVPLPLLAAALPALERWASSAEQQQAIGPAIKTLSQIAYPEMLWTPPVETSGGGVPPAVFYAVTAAWVLGVGVLLALWWRRARIACSPPLGAAPWHAADDVVERVTHAARSAGVPLALIRLTDEPVVPCVGNFRRPVVVLSNVVVRALRDDELRAVLVHENAHRRRGDLWRGALQRLTTCVFFFYPPAWWLTRRLRASAEMACDEAVLATGIDARTYARALARTVVLELAATPAPALASGRSHLRARLQRIQSPERYVSMARHRIAVAAAVIAAGVLSLVPIADGVELPYAESFVRVTAGAQDEWLPASGLSGLNGLEAHVDLSYQNAPLAQVLRELGENVGFDVYFVSSDDFTGEVSIGVSSTSVRDVLELVAEMRGLEYRVVDAGTLIVRTRADRLVVRRTPEGQAGAAPGEVPKKPVVRRTPAAAPAEPEGEAARGGEEPYRIGGDIQEPERIHYVSPEYPELARRARMEGFVILRAVVDREGNVRDAEVLRGLGLGLDVAARDAVLQWKYTPTYYNGEPVEVILTVTVAFQLIQ
jgi:protein TonB